MRGIIEEIFDITLNLIRSVEWFDIVDIVLVAVALYHLIKILRQTRAFHLVKGIVLMGILYLVVSSLNMSATSYLFNKFFGDIVIVMLLLFQPEIRHAIESIGRGEFRMFSLFSTKNSQVYENAENIASGISKAVSNMSDKKVGALIVVEGKTLLGEFTSTGSAVDAAVTSVILENIFFPKSPLHDGAVIIRDGRVHSAGCILPLTQNEISSELGTRHRAALGMSEHSDALVIVVSEETGSVSVANSGLLERNVTIGEVYETLLEFLNIDSGDTGRTFKILRRKK